MPLNGEVVFQRIVDLGGTLDLKKVRQILGSMVRETRVLPTHAAPDYVRFAAPIPVNLETLELGTLRSGEDTLVTVSARIYEVGALALSLRFAMQAGSLSELRKYQSLHVRTEKHGPLTRAQLFDAIAEALKPKLKPALDEIFDEPVEAERYCVFCCSELPGGVDAALKEARPSVAGLLVNEAEPFRMARSEVDEILKQSFSYYRDDLVVVDWDAAFLIEPSGRYEDMLYLSEVANLQLLMLRKYDQYLDHVLEKSYADYVRLTQGPPVFTGAATQMIRAMSEVRMDLARATDELANMAKFFGDWYLARVYLGLETKLHIPEYHKSLEKRCDALNELYQSVLGEIDRRQNLVLEVMIVALIVLELFIGLYK